MIRTNFSQAGRLGLITLAIVSVAAAQAVSFQNGTATFSQTFDRPYVPSESIDGITTARNGWAIFNPASGTQAQTAVWETTSSFSANSLTVGMTFNHRQAHLLGRFRLSVTSDDRATFADGLATGGDVTANWVVLSPTAVTVSGGLSSAILGDGSILMSGAPDIGNYSIQFNQTMSNITGLRLEAMEDPSLPTNGPGLQPSNGNFVLTELTAEAVPEPASVVALAMGAMGLLRRRRN